MAGDFHPLSDGEGAAMTGERKAGIVGPGPIDWRTAYDNRGAVAEAEAIIGRLEAEALAYRAEMGSRVETVAYGEGERRAVDLIWPEDAPRGLAVYVHGGYWQRGHRGGWTGLARGAVAAGWAVALPGYTLCPETTVAGITGEVAAGIGVAAARVPGPVRLAGHSAGGHLAVRMICPGVLAPETRARVASVLSISGIHDLRPLLGTPQNAALGLDLAAARAESPALMEPAGGVPVTAWVGAKELLELRRQSRILAEIWGGLGIATRLVEEPGQDHFTVVEALADARSPIAAAWLGG